MPTSSCHGWVYGSVAIAELNFREYLTNDVAKEHISRGFKALKKKVGPEKAAHVDSAIFRGLGFRF